MKKFKISQLALFSGVKPHTIRIWEQRFSIFTPHRSEGNVRYYSLAEVRLLLDVSLLISFGYKISVLSKLNPAQVAQLVEELMLPEAIACKAVNDLILLMYTCEIEEFEDVLDGCVHTLGIDETIKTVILPFMERVQWLTCHNNDSEVHFAIAALRKKISTGIENANPPALLQKTALLFLPEREHFDLLLLYAAYILKTKGLRVLYLGANVPQQNLEQIALLKKPDFLLTCLSQKQKFTLAPLLPFLQYHLPETRLLVLECEATGNINKLHTLQFLHYKHLDQIETEQPVFSFSAS